jgi:transcriptional antiterminator RfaH
MKTADLAALPFVNPPVAAADRPRWYIAITNRNQEKLAQYSLAAAKLAVYLPFYAATNHKGEIYGKPLFPGYVFVQLQTDLIGWTKIFSARGVASVLGNVGRPQPVPDIIIETVRAHEFDGFVQLGLVERPAPRVFEPGEQIKIRSGAHADPIDAIFQAPIDKDRCLVLITLLGNQRVAQADLARIV